MKLESIESYLQKQIPSPDYENETQALIEVAGYEKSGLYSETIKKFIDSLVNENLIFACDSIMHFRGILCIEYKKYSLKEQLIFRVNLLKTIESLIPTEL